MPSISITAHFGSEGLRLSSARVISRRHAAASLALGCSAHVPRSARTRRRLRWGPESRANASRRPGGAGKGSHRDLRSRAGGRSGGGRQAGRARSAGAHRQVAQRAHLLRAPAREAGEARLPAAGGGCRLAGRGRRSAGPGPLRRAPGLHRHPALPQARAHRPDREVGDVVRRAPERQHLARADRLHAEGAHRRPGPAGQVRAGAARLGGRHQPGRGGDRPGTDGHRGGTAQRPGGGPAPVREDLARPPGGIALPGAAGDRQVGDHPEGAGRGVRALLQGLVSARPDGGGGGGRLRCRRHGREDQGRVRDPGQPPVAPPAAALPGGGAARHGLRGGGRRRDVHHQRADRQQAPAPALHPRIGRAARLRREPVPLHAQPPARRDQAQARRALPGRRFR